MQTSSQPKLIQTPFADNGARQNIPNDSQIGITAGRASYSDGFPPLTRTPLAAGGVPPFGTDFNGVLNEITAAIRWSQAGSGYPFNAAFSTAISGYPKGAKIPNSTFDGFWLNTVEGNTANPENTTSALTGWVPSGFYGVTSITGLSGSSVTLTTLQAGRDRIILSGALTSNINLIVPAWVKTWNFSNNCTGSYSVTVKTPNGSGVAVPAGATAILSGDGTNINQGATPGSLLNIQIFTANGTAAKTPGAKKWKIRALGGGGGSSAAPATGTGQVSVSNGGGAGAYAEGVYDVTSISSAAITIGAGGPGGTSSSQYGFDGSATSVGNLISAPGGKAGLPAGPANPPFQPVANTNGASPTSWNIVGTSGPGAEAAVAVSTSYAAGSRGANSQLGVGGSIPAINNNANTGGGFGSGASGCANGPSQPVNAGAAGRSGIAIIEEYA